MSEKLFKRIPPHNNITAVLVLADGSVFWGYGLGRVGETVGEVCFNTSITGYQEILTDPSYAGQIINFTFPHIGNVGTNEEDNESHKSSTRGLVVRQDITDPSNFRSSKHLNDWCMEQNLTGISGIDTRKLTKHIRSNGAANGVIYFNPEGKFDIDVLLQKANEWPGLEGMDLALEVSCKKAYKWYEQRWSIDRTYEKKIENQKYHVVAIDYGIKHNILRCLASAGARVTVVPANTTAKEILSYNPSGIFLSNGPGDPAATGKYAIPVIKDLLKTNIPLFGICLGHQILALAIGAKTTKMHQGHRGANHPVMDYNTKKVEITSMNHGFTVDKDTLPADVRLSHISLFDKTCCGIELMDKPVFSVQHHPEASPGPQDSHYLFDRFMEMILKYA
ncbi:MAG: glutamine-hydrolyzing carbamoyl-phosphate synthase small subunit [Emcibacteraceae bacterium]|nr:glutamine-hydrolyzing carbamoyl-phosphate synthase small subunit [Emcibacteraceae bacterium]